MTARSGGTFCVEDWYSSFCPAERAAACRQQSPCGLSARRTGLALSRTALCNALCTAGFAAGFSPGFAAGELIARTIAGRIPGIAIDAVQAGILGLVGGSPTHAKAPADPLPAGVVGDGIEPRRQRLIGRDAQLMRRVWNRGRRLPGSCPAEDLRQPIRLCLSVWPCHWPSHCSGPWRPAAAKWNRHQAHAPQPTGRRRGTGHWR